MSRGESYLLGGGNFPEGVFLGGGSFPARRHFDLCCDVKWKKLFPEVRDFFPGVRGFHCSDFLQGWRAAPGAILLHLFGMVRVLSHLHALCVGFEEHVPPLPHVGTTVTKVVGSAQGHNLQGCGR